MSETVRPTKKQRELLTFIEKFIGEHGYSPSYREIMSGLNYTSVATVALHINNLIRRGHLKKRDHSARSLEVVEPSEVPKVVTNIIQRKGRNRLLIYIHFNSINTIGIIRTAEPVSGAHCKTDLVCTHFNCAILVL